MCLLLFKNNSMPQLEEFQRSNVQDSGHEPIRVDAKGSQCPGPIMSLAAAMRDAQIGQNVIIDVTDSGFKSDAISWSAVTGNTMQSLTEQDGVITAMFTKTTEMGEAVIPTKEDMLTIVVFSGEMDKGLAAFNIALGALAMGMKVEIFFTFWGLSLIRKKDKKPSAKNIKEAMLNQVLPNDDNSLPMSRENMLGLGAAMMKRIMKEKNVPSLDFMIHLAKYNGAKFIACKMSMDIMNIQAESLLDGIDIGGVATMLEFARKSNVNFFI